MTEETKVVADLDKTRVPAEHWSDLKARDKEAVCEVTGAVLDGADSFLIRFLGSDLLVDVQREAIWQIRNGSREEVKSPLLTLITLVYLLSATEKKINGQLIGVRELKDAHFFQGPHAIDVSSLLAHFGDDIKGFKKAAETLEGSPVDMADAAYRFMAFPKIPIYYLLWAADDEFNPRISILFDRSIESHLKADAILGLFKLVTDKLLIMQNPVNQPGEAISIEADTHK